MARGHKQRIIDAKHEFKRIDGLPVSDRAMQVADLRRMHLENDQINPTTMFVRVIEPPRVNGSAKRSKLQPFYRVQELRRECFRIWPGVGVMIDCFAEATHREPNAPLARRIELADLASRQAAQRIRSRLTDTARGLRLDLRVMHRLDVWHDNCAVLAKFLSDEEYAYWMWRYDHPKKFSTKADINSMYPYVPTDEHEAKRIAEIEKSGYMHQKAQTRYDGVPEPPMPGDVQHLTVPRGEFGREVVDWIAEYDTIWQRRAGLPVDENPAVVGIRKAQEAVDRRWVSEMHPEIAAATSVDDVVVRHAPLNSSLPEMWAGDELLDPTEATVRPQNAPLTEADQQFVDDLLGEALDLGDDA